jgi:16S rRNA G1207 methylase RsmC
MPIKKGWAREDNGFRRFAGGTSCIDQPRKEEESKEKTRMDRATLSRLRQTIDDLERLSVTLPKKSEEVIFLARIIHQLQILQDTVIAGDARETVFVCSEQIASIGRSRETFVRVAGLVLYAQAVENLTALQKEAHVFAAIQPQHHGPGKMIHG